MSETSLLNFGKGIHSLLGEFNKATNQLKVKYSKFKSNILSNISIKKQQKELNKIKILKRQQARSLQQHQQKLEISLQSQREKLIKNKIQNSLKAEKQQKSINKLNQKRVDSINNQHIIFESQIKKQKQTDMKFKQLQAQHIKTEREQSLVKMQNKLKRKVKLVKKMKFLENKSQQKLMANLSQRCRELEKQQKVYSQQTISKINSNKDLLENQLLTPKSIFLKSELPINSKKKNKLGNSTQKLLQIYR